jgi:hypothetical protein
MDRITMGKHQKVRVWLAVWVGLTLVATSHAADENINVKPNLEVEKKTDDGVLLGSTQTNRSIDLPNTDNWQVRTPTPGY